MSFGIPADGAVNCYTCTMVEGVSRDESCADPFVGSRTKRCSGLSCSKMKTQLNGTVTSPPTGAGQIIAVF